jgi:serine/threonine protein phosphatase 1
MFSSLFKKPVAASLPEGVVLFAIGDMHGRPDLLKLLLSAIVDEVDAARPGLRMIVVGLGDYIDRGPGSKEVVELLVQLRGMAGLETHFLRGNHEETLLNFLEDPMVGPDWSSFGGREALASYGIEAPARPDPTAWAAAQAAFIAALPPAHRAFFASLESCFSLGGYFFAHAGARPGVALEKQSEADLLWIRGPFLSSNKAFSQVVVHGHSPDVAAHADHRRIGIDTGAYATGVLTALRLEGTSRHLIQTQRGATTLVTNNL